MADNISVDKEFVKESVNWPTGPSPTEWIENKPADTWRENFAKDGYLVVENLLTNEELEIYQNVCTKMLNGEVDTSNHRHDLGNTVSQKQANVENICQILWPSLYVRHLDQGPVHNRVEAIARCLLGDDIVFDHDMILAKVALDPAVKDNGCMWFMKGSHKGGLRQHRSVKEGCHVLTCDTYKDDEKVCAEIPAGSCTFHHGRTLHYTQGNTTGTMRRAIVTSFRPASALEEFLRAGHDHGKRGLKSVLLSGQTHGWQDPL